MVIFRKYLHSSTTWFVSKNAPNYVRKLHKELYGLKQAPFYLVSAFCHILHHIGFYIAKSDTS